MRQTNVCSNRVFVPGVHASPRGLKSRRRSKRRVLNNNFTDRKHFIRRYQRNSWMDFSELRVIDSLYSEGTNTLVMGGLGLKGFVERGRINERH